MYSLVLSPLDVVTLKDMTADELRYVLGNILLTSRYGAVSSRVGRMDNQILGIFGGIAELPSSSADSCIEIPRLFVQLAMTDWVAATKASVLSGCSIDFPSAASLS